jgi:cyclopropane fatty-acyl-phospholipid synthase-like methyltransferase
MTDALLGEQVAYYRARAREYDRTAYPEGAAAAARIASLVAGLNIGGDVLELACGTGMWTAALAARGALVTAVDAAPEALRIAAARCPSNVHFELVDLFAWQPQRRFDVVLFAFWLSHVPRDRASQFFDRLRNWLAPDGRVVFVDEPAGAAGKERGIADGIVERTLTDGSRHRIVKVFLDPPELGCSLAQLGWRSAITHRGDWVIGQAWP